MVPAKVRRSIHPAITVVRFPSVPVAIAAIARAIFVAQHFP
jgi:hypothetical protein